MTSEQIKVLVPLSRLLDHYGSESKGKKRRCLKRENHTNGDSHFSASNLNDRLTCHSQECFTNADIFEVVGIMEGLQTFQEQKTKLVEMFGLNGKQTNQKKIVATYDYVNADGQLLFQTVRYDPKDFKQRRPDGKGGWIWNLVGVNPVLYRLPEIAEAENVLIVEGEKDVEAAYSLGLPEGWATTCNPMGAGKWRTEHSDALQDKTVVILPDADEVGRKHADQVAQSLQGKAHAILKLSLPVGIKDLSEWAKGKESNDV